MKYIDAWCTRMAARYGATLKDNAGATFTWRAALRREALDIIAVDEPTNPGTQLELEVAKAWEAGFWPKWAPRPETRLALPGEG